jgi:Uma2 family endonuclease
MALVLEDAFLPATLTVPPMTDLEFEAFCAEHPDLFFEMTADGELIVMPPTCTATGIRNARILARLNEWGDRNGGGYVTDTASGFVLPNGARRSPDAAWTPKAEVAKMSPEAREGFWHLCPEFVIELRSKSDRLRMVRAKMQEYAENGAKLGWLLDPQNRSVEIYRPGREVERIENAESISGEGPVEGFVLDLRPVWDPWT